MSEIVMPRLSDTMEEGTILRWLIAEGETVRRGQEIVEIETDKANMTYESDLEGPIAFVAAEGDTLPVGAVIARVGEAAPGEGAGPAERTRPQDTPTGKPSAMAPGATDGAGSEAESLREALQAPAPAPGRASSGAAPPAADEPEAGRVRASPLARRIAREAGVDLRTLTGSGPGGRIVKADVQAAASGTGPGPGPPAAPETIPRDDRAAASAQPTPPAGGIAGVARAKGEATEVELTRTQQTIARRMAESKATIPHFALRTEIDMGKCVALRSELKRLAPPNRPGETADGETADGGTVPTDGETPPASVPTYNDMVVKACALALREHPRANSSYRDGRVQLHGRVNVGVAVAVEGEDPAAGGALIVPTIFDADLKALGEIARETRALAARVRDGSVTPPELGGGTFTVSNLGMFGVDAFTAIVNPPQVAILAVGAVAARPVVVNDETGEIAPRPIMAATLACDHRVLYGADAARFLARVRELLEQPAALTL